MYVYIVQNINTNEIVGVYDTRTLAMKKVDSERRVMQDGQTDLKFTEFTVQSNPYTMS